MNFIQAIQSGFQNYANFKGRACRSEFWFWILFVVLASLMSAILDTAFFGTSTDDMGPLGVLVTLGLFLPGLAVSIRRLHDIDRSGWWYLIVLIPIVGVLVLIYWNIKKGTDGSNRFGNDPLFTIAG